MSMSEQKTEKEENEEEDIKPTKENVSNEYLKGYRVGYNRAVKRFKRGKLEIQVKKDSPIMKKEEVKQKEEVKKDEIKSNDRMSIVTALIIVAVLGLVVWYFVFRARNTEPNQ